MILNTPSNLHTYDSSAASLHPYQPVFILINLILHSKIFINGYYMPSTYYLGSGMSPPFRILSLSSKRGTEGIRL